MPDFTPPPLDSEAIETAFSQPFGLGGLYPRPPYRYRRAESLTVIWHAPRDPIQQILPPGVTVDGHEARVMVIASRYQATPFGAYTEINISVRVNACGKTFMYSPVMYASSEGALTAGRELWGFSKKLADMTLELKSNQWNFTASRGGRPLVDISVSCDAQTKSEFTSEIAFPTLTLRLIPGLSGHERPSVAELVSTKNVKRNRTDEFGDPELWSGRGAVEFHGGHATEALEIFRAVDRPVGWYSFYDCDLPAGELVWDYLAPHDENPSA